MLLSDKSIALINPEHARFTPKPRKHLIDRRLQESLILGDFQAKMKSVKKKAKMKRHFGQFRVVTNCYSVARSRLP